MLVFECYRSDWSNDGHMSHVKSVRETVYSIQSDSLKYMKQITDVSHKKLKHQRRCVTVVNSDGHSRTSGSVQEPGVRPGARKKSASPAWPATRILIYI